MDTTNPSSIGRNDHTIPLLIFGGIGTLVFIFASALFVYNTIQHLVAARDWRDHSEDVLTNLQSTSQQLDRIDASSRLYLLSKSQQDLMAAHSSAITLDANVTHLAELVDDNPSQTSRTINLRNCTADVKHQLDLLTSGTDVQRKIVECRDYVSKIREAERSLLTQRIAESQKSDYRSFVAGVGFLVISLGVVSALFAFLMRDAVRRQRLDRQIFTTNTQLEVTVLTLQKRAADSGLLISAREELQLCTSAPQAYPTVIRYAKQLLPSTNVALMMINNSRNMVEIVGESDVKTNLLDGFPLDACCGLRTGRLRWRKPGQSEVHCHHFLGAPPENYICIPLAAQGETLGILYIECPTSLIAVDTERNLENLQLLAETAAMSIAGLNLRSRLEHQSIRDGLTDLFNRHFMEISLDREVRRAARNHTELSVLMLDVDHFKQFNDTYGHEAGDLILRGVGDIFRRSVRSEDIICRYGGEEFIVILPDTGQEAAMERAETIRSEVSRMRMRFHGDALREVTISIGVAVYPLSGETLEELLRASDRALYAAKHAGRNQVVAALPTAAMV